MKEGVPAFCVAISFLAVAGCGHRSEVKPAMSPAAPSVAGGAASASAAADVRHYVVRKGDSLWGIAGRPAVFGDAFHWPLLYRQNRDQIQDPDLIEVSQDLQFRRAFETREIEEAVRLAKETPPYVPHAVPRKTLPVKY